MTPDDRAVLDRVMADLQMLRDRLEKNDTPKSEGPEPDADDDFAAENLIDAGTAAQRARVSKQTIRRWVKDHSIGFKRGGRLLVSVPRLRRHVGDDAL